MLVMLRLNVYTRKSRRINFYIRGLKRGFPFPVSGECSETGNVSSKGT